MKLKGRWKHIGASIYASDKGVRMSMLGWIVVGGKKFHCDQIGIGDYYHKVYRILSRKRKNPRKRALMLWAERMDDIEKGVIREKQ